jgi:hypothetical protein
MTVFWVGWDEDCLDSGEVSVYLSHRKFVVEVNITSETLDQNRGSHHAAIVHQQTTVEGVNNHLGVVVNAVLGKACTDEFNALCTRKRGVFPGLCTTTTWSSSMTKAARAMMSR